MNIKESAFRVLELEFSSAQKYIDKLNLDIITMKKNKEKYIIIYICYYNIVDFIKYFHVHVIQVTPRNNKFKTKNSRRFGDIKSQRSGSARIKKRSKQME